VSFATITLYVASQRVIPNINVYFVINSVRELLDTPTYVGRISLRSPSVTYYYPYFTGTSYRNVSILSKTAHGTKIRRIT
jgi:hypothetical protein